MPQMMLSGFMFPLAALPTWLYALTFAIPLRYIIVIVRSNFLKGSSFNSLWPQFTALAALSLVIFVFALSRFQKRLAD
jgi:ABC-2 type transport system permease protein